MWGQGGQRAGHAILIAAIGLLCRDANGQIDAVHPQRSAPSNSLQSLAPATLPAADSTAVDIASPPPADDAAVAPYRNDAAINDLAFVDGQQGWAVGDAGVIWHTIDGGRHWLQQASGVTCRLRSVQFVDLKNGWAAGGRTAPYTHLTTGVLLRTHDGGEHWTTVEKLLLPALRRIQFSSLTHGCAIGQTSALYPCGIFFTDDGGRQWSPLPTADTIDCTAGNMIDVGHGALALSDGRMAIVRDGRIQPASCPPTGLASVRQIQFSGPRVGWLVGEDGLVRSTADGGQTWQSPPTEIPAEIRRTFEFCAVAVRGSQVWIAGSPGNCVFHSADWGRSWTAGDTEQHVPISAMTFIDDLHGWCAGALGTIEATDDGGRTWHRQRTGGERVALMGVFSEPRDVPIEMFARESAADGYLSVVELINRRDVETHSPASAALPDCVQEALVSLGVQRAHVAWQFPLRQAGIDLPAPATTTIWDQAVDGNGLAELDAHLVRQIRIWRPSVVVTSDAEGESRGAAARLLQQALAQAVRQAADPKFDNHMPPWSVQRIFAAVPLGQPATVTNNSSQLAPRLGQSLAEMTWEPRGLMFDRYAAAADTLGFRPLENPLAADSGSNDFFSGLGLRPGGDARRELPQPTLEAITALRRAAQQRRNAQAILKRTSEGAAAAGWLAQINDLTAAMDASSAGEILFQLGQRSVRAGHSDSATQVFELLVSQYPQHPLAAPAQVWLLQTYASSIAEHETPVHAAELKQPSVVAASVPANAVSSFTGAYRKTYGAEQPIALQTETAPVVRQMGGVLPAGSSPPASRAQHAVQIAGQIERFQPALFAEPSVRFPLAAAYRRLGMGREAEHTLIGLRSGSHDAWWSCAEAENWLVHGQGPTPKSVWHCAVASERPRLDGTLDDPIWQHAETVELHSALQDDADWPATARIACDAQFLYLAVHCRQAPGMDDTPAKTPRPRQADLSASDHVDLLLSPDRDYTSYYRLSIDHRGWVNSGCWNDAPWQPVCYVAAGARDGGWIVEAAIPWDQMVDHAPVGRRQPWAANIQRTVPGVGFQSWSNPASVAIQPEGMGLLLFDSAAAPKPHDAKPTIDDKTSR
jgi:photosystem II stability/assembly factor-like uncharacterized protein